MDHRCLHKSSPRHGLPGSSGHGGHPCVLDAGIPCRHDEVWGRCVDTFAVWTGEWVGSIVSVLRCRHQEIVEGGSRVGLAPEAHTASLHKRLVGRFEVFLTAQITLNPSALMDDLEPEPLARRNINTPGAGELLATAVLDVINTEITLQRIVSSDVIVVGVLGPPDQSAPGPPCPCRRGGSPRWRRPGTGRCSSSRG